MGLIKQATVEIAVEVAVEMANTSVTERVVVVDDEVSICRALEQILSDEGIPSVYFTDGESALTYLETNGASLVLLDIWLPGLDGIAILKLIKATRPSLPVVMISGHATITTAVEATRLGAEDFIEKPLDLSTTLNLVRKILKKNDSKVTELFDGDLTPPQTEDLQITKENPEANESTKLAISRESERILLLPAKAFVVQAWRGNRLPQRTLVSSAILYGQGLHSGKKSGLILQPLPPNSGIHFVGVSGDGAVPAHIDYVHSTGFATTLRRERTQIGTIEHVMSALHAYGVSNLLIKCNSEVPVMDGSAQEFCELFQEIGLKDQDSDDWFPIAVPELLRVQNGDKWIQIEPADQFSIDYTLSYPEPVGTQQRTFTLTDSSVYLAEIAPARTFGFVKDISALQRQGLALGGRFDNFVLIGEDGPINDSLRFSDEFARHKILDVIGDLFLLGRPLQGKITAHMTGHSDNLELLKAVKLGMDRA